MDGQRGFTIIEMAMVLVVLGLLVGGGVMAVGPVIDKTRLNQTSQAMDQIEAALVLFAIRNNRLPCPADGSLLASNANYGLEQPSGGGSGCTVYATLGNAVIPWRTLGLDETYSIDGWYRRISYFVANTSMAIVNEATSLTDTTTIAPLSRKNTSSPPTYPTGPFLIVKDTNGNTLTPATGSGTQDDQAAYVIISHGKSGYYGWTKGGTQLPIPDALAGGNKTKNNIASGGTATFVQGSPNPTNTAAFFDDIVRWRSPAMIIQLCGSGACGNP